MGYDKTNLQQERRNAYEKGYHQAEKDLDVVSWIKEVSGVKDMSRAKEEALKAYDKGLELCLEDSPMNASALNRRGNALVELGRFSEALDCFDKAINIDKDNTNFLLNNETHA